MLQVTKSVLSWLADALPDISNILLAVLGVLMSFPAKAEEIEKNPFWRKVIAYTCIGVALAGFAASTYQRRHFNSQISRLLTDDDKLVINTTNLVKSANVVVTDFSIVTPKLNAVEDHLAKLNLKIAAAREKHDPRLIADLEAQAALARAQADNLSRTLLLSLAPGIVQQMRYLADQWDLDDRWLDVRPTHDEFKRDHPEIKESDIEEARFNFRRQSKANLTESYMKKILPVMISANSLRVELLQGSQETDNDRKNAVLFAKVLAGESIRWAEMGQVAGYMEGLIRKTMPPSNLRGTVQ